MKIFIEYKSVYLINDIETFKGDLFDYKEHIEGEDTEKVQTEAEQL